MQQLDELFGILVVRHDPLLDLDLLLQNRHFAIFFRQLGLEGPQHIVFSSFVFDLGVQLLIGLVQRIEIDVVIRRANHQGRNKQYPGPRCQRHFTEFRHIKPPTLNCWPYDCFCTFPVNVGAISQFSSNLNACTSFTEASCNVSLISTVLNAPVFLKLAIKSATALGLSAMPVKFSVLPSLVIVSSQTASVEFTVSATRFSRFTGPACAALSSSITRTRRSYRSAFFLLASYFAFTSASRWFSRMALCRSFSSLSCVCWTHTWASPISTARAPTKISASTTVLDPSPPGTDAAVARRPRDVFFGIPSRFRSEENTSELQSHSFISYAVFSF